MRECMCVWIVILYLFVSLKDLSHRYYVCVCVCGRACVRACACVCADGRGADVRCGSRGGGGSPAVAADHRQLAAV